MTTFTPPDREEFESEKERNEYYIDALAWVLTKGSYEEGWDWLAKAIEKLQEKPIVK